MQNFDEPEYNKIGALPEEFLTEYARKDDATSDEDFFKKMFAKKMPKTSAEEINEICEEILNSNADLEKFLNEAKNTSGYENATQDWFCEKIKHSIDEGDYDFIQRLRVENEILDAVNQGSVQLSKDFQKLDLQKRGDNDGSSYAGAIISEENHHEKTISRASGNIRRASLDASVKKSILNQYKRMMHLDFASMNLRADISNVAANLSRNVALTGICGMALTTGLVNS